MLESETGMKPGIEATPVHFLLRVPWVTRIEGHPTRAINTIDAHSKKIRELGYSTVAKFGRPSPAHTIQRLNKQIHEGRCTRLILVVKTVVKRGITFVGYQSEISSIRAGPPTTEIKVSAPSYYQELSYAAGLWFIVRTPFAICDLTKLYLASNKKPVLDVLSKCRTPSMLVENIVEISRQGRGQPSKNLH
jgi:hypothetical protein